MSSDPFNEGIKKAKEVAESERIKKEREQFKIDILYPKLKAALSTVNYHVRKEGSLIFISPDLESNTERDYAVKIHQANGLYFISFNEYMVILGVPSRMIT